MDMDGEAKKLRKNEKQRENRGKGKKSTAELTAKAHVLFVLGTNPFSSVKVYPKEAFHDSEIGQKLSYKPNMENFVNWITDQPIHHFDVLEILEKCPTLLENRVPLNWRDPALMKMFRMKALENNLPPLINLLPNDGADAELPILDFNLPASGEMPSKTILMNHPFQVYHSNHLLAYFGSKFAERVNVFVRQEVLYRMIQDPKVQRFISINFDVLYHGSDVKLLDLDGRDGLV